MEVTVTVDVEIVIKNLGLRDPSIQVEGSVYLTPESEICSS